MEFGTTGSIFYIHQDDVTKFDTVRRTTKQDLVREFNPNWVASEIVILLVVSAIDIKYTPRP